MRSPFLGLAFLFIALIVACCDMYAQESNGDSTFNARIGVHLNMNLLYTGSESTTYDPALGITTNYRNKIIGLSFKPAMRVTTRRGNAMEFALDELYYSVDDQATVLVFDSITGTTVASGEKVTTIGFGPRYEFNYIFLKKDKIRPYVGLSSMVFYRFHETKPANSNFFRTRSESLGTELLLVPGMLVNHLSKFYLTFSFPIHLGTFAIKTNHTDNPSLPKKTRTTTVFDYDYFASLRFRIAYGVYLR
ncbi:MAG: hypothetical protein JKY52_15450 [Flavobacteriales bacterium]|nr:hypothetical protein [Flavobacteriales bacterium]